MTNLFLVIYLIKTGDFGDWWYVLCFCMVIDLIHIGYQVANK
jgi:hypothetical protein